LCPGNLGIGKSTDSWRWKGFGNHQIGAGRSKTKRTIEKQKMMAILGAELNRSSLNIPPEELSQPRGRAGLAAAAMTLRFRWM
jgi:hypothetical protein